jgi:uncharacterized protein YraI
MLHLKKWSRALLALTLVSSAAAAQARDMVSVARSEINMRTGAGTQTAALWTLNRGYPLEVTGRQNQWFKVQRAGGLKGWIARRLLWGW